MGRGLKVVMINTYWFVCWLFFYLVSQVFTPLLASGCFLVSKATGSIENVGRHTNWQMAVVCFFFGALLLHPILVCLTYLTTISMSFCERAPPVSVSLRPA